MAGSMRVPSGASGTSADGPGVVLETSESIGWNTSL